MRKKALVLRRGQGFFAGRYVCQRVARRVSRLVPWIAKFGVLWTTLRGHAEFFGSPGAQVNVLAALAAKRA